ncbi:MULTISPECIES: DNA repair protein RecN [unclassified Treponema]|uniref:DNA repair protein RecN n=1 Tax=unclassified Treponema TaxID=2638727 RepID=UPI0020A4DD89|nr:MULTISPECIES: DNA repair protein RecN [unclassified Treponema]UTC68367.1 DNA repair protein RecN [Treponema sp. OMZ 789]UTC71087.1 DNA repair protein RecN [Treponema sp. OMZ 790]UTC73828.1 DNA repair protein RecN [Treponema sp. OMZ 791]
MLENISVKNIALIDSLFVEFENGLNVLSGETGAGKSILIGALTLLLGGKTTADLIRSGTDEAAVSGSFFIGNGHSEALKWLSEHGIEPEDNRILIRRNLKQNGRSNAWIQSTPVTRNELEDFTSLLVDIHGQHDHQSLFRIAEHRRFLDSFAGINNEVKLFTSLYAELAEKRTELEGLNLSEKELAEKQELLQFAIDEINKAKLKEDEKEELEAEEKRLSQFEKLFESLNTASQLFSDDSGIISLTKKAMHHLESAKNCDDGLEDLSKRLETGYYELDDISSSIDSYLSKLTFNPERVEQVQERLSLIYKLTKKYGASIKEVLDYAQNAEEQLENLSKRDAGKAELENAIGILESKILKLGRSLSEKRKQASVKLQKEVEEVLSNLGMQKTKFQVRVDTRLPEGNRLSVNPYGFDDIEFMISPNAGEPLRPLAKIASGGELSRVMLALKTVLAAGDEADTLIFDEIDTGIGGEVAVNVASHMKKLSKKKQILCITHLAVIASHADNHIKIEKNTIGQTTKTSAAAVSGKTRLEEIARMLAGDELSEASLRHAEELLLKYVR